MGKSPLEAGKKGNSDWLKYAEQMINKEIDKGMKHPCLPPSELLRWRLLLLAREVVVPEATAMDVDVIMKHGGIAKKILL